MGMRNDSCMTYLYAVVSRQPGGGRCCSSGMSHGFSKEASRCRIETAGDIGIEHVSGVSLDGFPYLLHRLLACSSGSAAKTVGCKLRCPFWFSGHFDQHLRGPLMHARDAEGACCRFAGLV